MTLDSGLLEKRSMRIAGHRTSVALERPFWARLESMAKARSVSLPVMIAMIDQERARNRPAASLASALRVEALRAADNRS